MDDDYSGGGTTTRDFFGGLSGAIGAIGDTVRNIRAGNNQTKPARPATQGGLPSWVKPVAIGAGILAALFIVAGLFKK